MTAWLYQMNSRGPNGYPHHDFRAEVREGIEIEEPWALRYIRRHSVMPEPGDRIVLFYCKSAHHPGIYGWGTITRRTGTDIVFRPDSPSDRLKFNPIWDDEVIRITNQWRGRVWRVTTYEDTTGSFEQIRRKIDQFAAP